LSEGGPNEGLFLKPRGVGQPVPFAEDGVEVPAPDPATPLDEADYVALDVETTGNTPFLVIEIGAERFRLSGSLSLFDTLVHTRAPINTYARRRHQISRDMLEGAPEFPDARRAFLHFARGAVLVEHSHDAFDSYLIGRGLRRPLENPIIDTSTLARLVLDLPIGQTPGLARVVEELGLDASPAHAALGDAQATAAVFRELAQRARRRFGWEAVGDLLAATQRPPVDRSALEGGPRHGTRRPGKGKGGLVGARRAPSVEQG
jgi:DNA polymerase-3 subunit epsilon